MNKPANPAYRSTGELFYETSRSLVFRGERTDGVRVLIKQLRGLYPNPTDVAWSRREFDILTIAAGSGVVTALDHIVEDGRVWLVLEHFDGVRLSDLFTTSRPSVAETVEIALRLVHVLKQLHQRNIVHKNLSPQSVLWHRETAELRLTDLGSASTVTLEAPSRKLPTGEVDLHFMAPEQTGRMNRVLDHRTDYYAVGCLLYWLLRGEPPFSGDALDLVHAHIARNAVPLSVQLPHVPQSLSQLVQTLLAKRAEDRYQTADGLINDLITCRDLVDDDNPITLKTGDVEVSFRIGEQLYGRERELDVLRAACTRVETGGRELVLVAGPPGIGKTALVHEVLEPAIQYRGNLVSGKFDQINRDVPYTSLVQALRQLLLQILVESPEHVSRWRKRLLSALGDSGQVLTELIGELELVIGAQQPVESLPPEDARRRLELVFRRFVGAFASADHPLVLFLDDLQWADLPSLRLIEALVVDPAVTHLLVIGAYRDIEVGRGNAVLRMADTVREAGVAVGLIHLGPLTTADINALISKTLHCAPSSCKMLAQLCETKTGGNPFYLRRFLGRLYADRLLHIREGKWHWELDAIERQSATENVVAFMSGQLGRLPETSRKTLERAACLGTTFGLHKLATLSQLSHRETQIALKPALLGNLVYPLNDQYWVGSDDSSTPDFQFAFAHDRIQQAAHDGLTQEEQSATHLAIGRSLLQSSDEEQRGRLLFDIVGHLNQAIVLIKDPEETTQLATLNLAAGRRALASAAYPTAHHCLQIAVQLLDADAWNSNYSTTLDLHVVGAQAAYLATDDAEMNRLVATVVEHATSQLDRLRAQEILVYGLIARNDLLGAVHKTLDLLDELGFKLPRAPSQADIGDGLGILLERLSHFSREAIAGLPSLDNARVAAARRLMTGVASAAYLTVPSLLPLLAFQVVQSTLDDGISRDSPYGFALFALVLAAVKLVDVAYQNGKVAMDMLSHWDERSIRVRPTHVYNSMVRFWIEPVRDTLPDFLRNYADGIDTGDIEYALWTAHTYCYQLYYAGSSLDRVGSEIAEMMAAMRHHKQLAPLAVTLPFAQLVENLRGESSESFRVVGRHLDETSAMSMHLASNYRGAVFVLSTCMVMARVFFGQWDEADKIAQQYYEYRDGATATMHVASLEFYATIAQLAGSNPDIPRAMVSCDALGVWAGFNPASFGHWHLAVKAEIARVSGDVVAALDGFDAAIAHAARYGLPGEQALLNERAALFHLGRGSRRIARSYLLEARQAYEHWGAVAKVAQLEQLHADSLLGTESSRTSALAVGDLDLEALFRASLVISEEIRLEHLLRKIVAVSVQNAAATRGFLVVERGGSLLVEVGIDAEGLELVTSGTPLAGCPELAAAVVQLVARTGEGFVLTDATRDRRFQADPYLARRGVASILCTPIGHKGSRHSIIYLENHLIAECFTPIQLKMVQVLAGQAAVSIENAKLVDNLESHVAERTEALERALEQTRIQHRQLVESQRGLLLADRLAVLGQLVAGVAHELNSPLGAIGASSDNLAASVDGTIHTLNSLVSSSTPDERASLVALLSVHGTPILSSRDQRSARRSLTLELEGHGIPHASEAAEILVQLGVVTYVPAYHVALTSPSRAELLGAASAIVSLRFGIGNIQEAARRMSRIVFALQSYASAGGGDSVYPANLSQSIDTVLTLYGHQLRLGFEVVREYEGDVIIEGMHDRLSQVWTNLVHNALQAMGTQGTLTLRITRSGPDHVSVAIADTGPGIPPDIRERIFEPFFTTKAIGEGSGLGLSICKDIVDAHHGEITVDSVPGCTTFTVRLPVKSSSSGADNDNREEC